MSHKEYALYLIKRKVNDVDRQTWVGSILAVITTQKERVQGGAPIFIVDNLDELEKLSFTLEKILDAEVHALNQETYIVVRHG
ncbi:MAG: hypothetical protein RBR24_08285 [Candidatus Carbobacillus sp.]|nr:hypothetical protein [Candidatus Carbobacillus sp.]